MQNHRGGVGPATPARAACSALLFLAACSSGDPFHWPVSSPAEQSLDPRPFEALDAEVRAGRYGYIDHIMILRHGHVVMNEHYERDYVAASAGADPTPHQYNYRHPDWHPYFSGRDVHSLQSITKSITSALIGIAIGRGELAGIEEPIVSFLGDYDLSRADPRFQRATIEDLLTMRTGVEWHESDRPADSTNTTIQLEGSHDWVQFVLDQPMDADPGERWVYNSGTSHLMSEIIRSATGMTVDEYAEAHLFGPLGIEEYHWKITPTGLPDTEGGLYLEPADLARIGQLYLDDGVWNGRRILPEGWVASSTARHADPVNEQGWGYGYQWWRVDRDDTVIWAGLGYGGQHLVIMPELDMVGVVNAWNLFGPTDAPMFPAVLEAMIAAAR